MTADLKARAEALLPCPFCGNAPIEQAATEVCWCGSQACPIARVTFARSVWQRRDHAQDSARYEAIHKEYRLARALLMERTQEAMRLRSADKLVDQLVSVIADTQRALGITDEEAACANGSEEIVDAIALLSSRSEGWQDISTAPKDGTKILLSDGKRIGIGYWLKDYASGHPCRDWFSDMLSAGFPHNPTRWMSLPALPKENT